MKLDPKVRNKLESARFDDVDDLWMSKLAESPDDVAFFVPVVRALLQRTQDERAALLVQLWLDEQRRRLDHARLLAPVRTMLAVWPDFEPLRTALLDALRGRYHDRPSLETLLEHFDPARAADLEQALVGLETWLRYDVGRLVAMAKLGVGRVSQINLGLGSLRVEFASGGESFRLAEAERLLEPLAEDHFLAQKVEQPEALRRLARDDPGELLRRVFASLGNPLPLATLRSELRDLLPAGDWATWWKRVRQDPRLTAGAGARATCTWSDSAAAAQEQLLGAFEAASDVEKLDMLRQHLGHSPDVQRALLDGMVRLLDADSTGPAVKLEAALFLDELHDGGVAAAAPAAWDASRTRSFLERRLAGDDHATAARLAALRDRRARERGLEIACRLRPEPGAFLVAFVKLESDARTLGVAYAQLRQRQALLESVVRDTLVAPQNAPRWYVWLCREMTRRDELALFIDWRFLHAFLDACDAPALKSQRAALRELFDPGGLAVRSVERLEREQAAQLLAILERDMGVEEHRKDNVRRAVWHRFPDLESRAREDAVYVTAESLESKRAEFEQLVRVEIPRNTEEIRKAAAHGDLRENFEYKSARERQEMLSSRAKSIHEELRRARALDPGSIDATVVRVGTRVRLDARGDGRTRTLTILGPWDSDPGAGVFSYLAPAVAELLGKRVGDPVRFADENFTVGCIEVWKP